MAGPLGRVRTDLVTVTENSFSLCSDPEKGTQQLISLEKETNHITCSTLLLLSQSNVDLRKTEFLLSEVTQDHGRSIFI